MDYRTKKLRRKGFTLAESLIASTILAMACAGIILPFTTANANQLLDARRNVAAVLAQELMEEILSKPFNDPDGSSAPGPENGENQRSRYDNIDDYDGFADGYGQRDPLESFDGEEFDEPAARYLSRTVKVEYVYVAGQDTSKPPTFVRVEVTVKYYDVQEIKLTRLAYAFR